MLKINIKYLVFFIFMVFLIKIGVADPLRGQRDIGGESSGYSDEMSSFSKGR